MADLNRAPTLDDDIEDVIDTLNAEDARRKAESATKAALAEAVSAVNAEVAKKADNAATLQALAGKMATDATGTSANGFSVVSDGKDVVLHSYSGTIGLYSTFAGAWIVSRDPDGTYSIGGNEAWTKANLTQVSQLGNDAGYQTVNGYVNNLNGGVSYGVRDMTVNRGDGTGCLYFATGSAWLHYDGGKITANVPFWATQLKGTSDVRVKRDFLVIDDALEKLEALLGYTYLLEGLNYRTAGYIAQDVERVLPEAVSEGNDERRTKAVDIAGVVALIGNALLELKDEVRALQGSR